MDRGRTLPEDVGRDLLDELVVSKRLLEAVFHAAAEAIVHLDEERRIVRFNAGAERLLGYSPVSVMGSPLEALLHASNDADPFVSSIEPVPLQLAFRDTEGEPVRVRARSAALQGEHRPEGWILAFEPLRRVDEIEQLKTELVSTVSHELKTPLAAIKAYTATLRQNPELYATHRDEFLGIVEQQADRLSRLVDDMLLVTRVERGQLLRRRVRVPLQDVVTQALQEISYDPARHPVECALGGAEVSGDPERLRDILRNLIENAIKYSPAGGAIDIRAQQSGDTTAIDVRDRGIGIAEEHLPYIFDRFYRVESEVTSTVGGSGLGLYIVSALVRAHGGTLDVRSTPGQGSVFTLRLPLR